MPRKKVAPDDRIRVAKACKPCRQRKKKCDGLQPCTNCVKRDIPDECDIVEDPRSLERVRKQSNTASSRSNDAQARDDGNNVSEHLAKRRISEQVNASHSEAAIADETPSYAYSVSAEGASPEVSVRTNPRMLSNARGEHVFIGEHASLSFLQLMRDIVHTSIGASEFSSAPQRNVMLEAELNEMDDLSNGIQVHGRIEQCIDAYLLATNGLIDLFDRDQVIDLVNTVLNDDCDANPTMYALAYLVLAIGSQVRTIDISPKAQVLFAIGRKVAFQNFLQDPGIKTAQAFLLCAFYMFGACRRNAAYMYLGISSRAAHSVGLNNYMTYDLVDHANNEEKSRTWRSIFSFDIIACSILGRPPASLTVKAGSDHFFTKSNAPSTQAWQTGTSVYKLARIVEDITISLNGRKTLHVEDAERQVEIIQDWRRQLPDVLRGNNRVGTQDFDGHRNVIGSLHISCFHQFSILLVTRPFLVPVLMKRIAIQQRSPLASTDIMSDIDEARASRLAHTCVNVAVQMAQNCSNVYLSGYMLDNMCLLKAWIFSAALVIGFHLFAITESDAEAANAFSQSQTILGHIARCSPQAQHYSEILSYLGAAIEKRQQQRATPSRKQNAFSIDGIMHVSTSNYVQKETIDFQRESFEQAFAMPTATVMSTDTWLNQMPADDAEMQQFLQSSEFGWNSAMMPFWSQFSFNPSE